MNHNYYNNYINPCSLLILVSYNIYFFIYDVVMMSKKKEGDLYKVELSYYAPF